MILNQAQAEAVYSAMCNDGRSVVNIGPFMRAKKMPSGTVWVTNDFSDSIERYADQSAFAAAYSLN